MTLRADALARFGPDWVAGMEASAGCHGEFNHNQIPAPGKPERLIYGLLEAVDFCCPDYDWGCPRRDLRCSGVTLAELHALLRDHREEVLTADIAPPSWLGVLAGAFEFLQEEGP